MTRVPHSSAAIPAHRRLPSRVPRVMHRPAVAQVHTLLRACVLLVPAAVLPSSPLWAARGVAQGALLAACCALLALWRTVRVMA